MRRILLVPLALAFVAAAFVGPAESAPTPIKWAAAAPQRDPGCRIKAGQTPRLNAYEPARVIGSNKPLAEFADVNSSARRAVAVHYDGVAQSNKHISLGGVVYWMSIKMSVGHEENAPDCFAGDRWRFRAHSWCWKILPDGQNVDEKCNHRINQAHYDIKPCWPDQSCGYDTVGAADYGTKCAGTVSCYFDGGWHGPYTSIPISVRSRALDWQVRFITPDWPTQEYDTCSYWVYINSHLTTYPAVCTGQ